jgi:hypothetical protein
MATVSPANAQSLKPAQRADADAIVSTLRTMYAAAMADDLAKLDTLFAPGFYMFDGGHRYEGDSVMKLIDADRAKGYVFVWSVTQPDVHVFGDHAWIAYINSGSVKMPGEAAPTPMTWLESANIEKHSGVWKIVFLQSTRVPTAQSQ